MNKEADLRKYLVGYQGLYDGQYNLDISPEILQEEFIQDVNSSLPYANTLLLEERNGLLLSRLMEWDTAYFGYPVHKLDHLFTDDKLVLNNLLAHYLENLQTQNVKYVFARIKSDNLIFQNALATKGFELMLHKVMLRLTLPGAAYKHKATSPENILIRPFINPDTDFVRTIAGNSLKFNRFAPDSEINPALVAGIYQNWVSNLIKNTPESILIAEYQNQPAGMIAMSRANSLYGPDKFPEYPMGFISLVAVSELYRSKGIGQALIKAAALHFSKQNCKVVFANTALQNISSLLMFQRLGFKVFSMVSEYRRWLNKD